MYDFGDIHVANPVYQFAPVDAESSVDLSRFNQRSYVTSDMYDLGKNEKSKDCVLLVIDPMTNKIVQILELVGEKGVIVHFYPFYVKYAKWSFESRDPVSS